MAVGQTFVILTAGIDLSVGSVLVLAGVVTDQYCIHHGGANAGWGAIAVGAGRAGHRPVLGRPPGLPGRQGQGPPADRHARPGSAPPAAPPT